MGSKQRKQKKGREEQKWGDGWIDGARKDTWKTYLKQNSTDIETEETAERRVRHKEIKKKQMRGEGEYRV